MTAIFLKSHRSSFLLLTRDCHLFALLCTFGSSVFSIVGHVIRRDTHTVVEIVKSAVVVWRVDNRSVHLPNTPAAATATARPPEILRMGKRFACLSDNLRLVRIASPGSPSSPRSLGHHRPNVGSPYWKCVCEGVDGKVSTVDEREGEYTASRGVGVEGVGGRSEGSKGLSELS